MNGREKRNLRRYPGLTRLGFVVKLERTNCTLGRHAWLESLTKWTRERDANKYLRGERKPLTAIVNFLNHEDEKPKREPG